MTQRKRKVLASDIVGFGDTLVLNNNTSILCVQCVLEDLVAIINGESTIGSFLATYRYPVKQWREPQTYQDVACPRCGKHIFNDKEF